MSQVLGRYARGGAVRRDVIAEPSITATALPPSLSNQTTDPEIDETQASAPNLSGEHLEDEPGSEQCAAIATSNWSEAQAWDGITIVERVSLSASLAGGRARRQ